MRPPSRIAISHWKKKCWPALKNCAREGRTIRTILFIDESGGRERPHRIRPWAPKGKPPVLHYSFTWNQLSAIAGVTFWNIYFKLVKGAIRAPEIVAFLKNLRRHRAPRKLRIIWDRLQAHRSRMVRDYVASEGGDIRLEFLPAYAPELHPVEYLGAHWKQHEMPNFCAKDFAELSAFARAMLNWTPRRKTLVAAF
jgi:transposase